MYKGKWRAAGLLSALLLLPLCGCSLLYRSTQSITSDQSAIQENPKCMVNLDKQVPGQPVQLLSAEFIGDDGAGAYVQLSGADHNILLEETIGKYGQSVHVSGEFDSGTLIFTYDADNLGEIPADNLMLLYCGEDMMLGGPVEDAAIDAQAQTMTASITEEGYYIVVDAFAWLSAWGVDLSDTEMAHDRTYCNTDYGFSMVIPKEIMYTYCSTFAESLSDGSEETELLYIMNGEDSPLGMELYDKELFTPYAEFMDSMLDSWSEQEGLLLSHDRKVMPTGMYGDFVLLSENGVFWYTGYYQISKTRCIRASYRFSDRDVWEERVKELLYSFRLL